MEIKELQLAENRYESLKNNKTSVEHKIQKLDTYFENEQKNLKLQLKADDRRMAELSRLGDAKSLKEYEGKCLYGVQIPKEMKIHWVAYIAFLIFVGFPVFLGVAISCSNRTILASMLALVVLIPIALKIISYSKISNCDKKHLAEIKAKSYEEFVEINTNSVPNYQKAIKKLEAETVADKERLESELSKCSQEVEEAYSNLLAEKVKLSEKYGISVNHNSNEFGELIDMVNSGYNPNDAEYELRRREAELGAYRAQQMESMARERAYEAQTESAERVAMAQEQMARDNAEALREQSRRAEVEEARRASARKRYADASAVAVTGVGRGSMSSNKEIAEMEKARALADLL